MGLESDYADVVAAPVSFFYDYDYPEEAKEGSSFRGGEDYRHYARALKDLNAKRVLEFGGGTGRFALGLAREGLQVDSIERSEAMLRIAKRKLGDANSAGSVRFFCDDVCRPNGALGERGMAYDAVVAPFSFMNIAGGHAMVWEAVSNAHGKLRENGYLVFDITNPLFYWELPKNSLALMLSGRLPDGAVYYRFRFFTHINVNKAINEHGWYDISRDGALLRAPYSISFQILFLDEVRAILEKTSFKIEHIGPTLLNEGPLEREPRLHIVARRTGKI